MKEKKLIIIAGPTAVGKSTLAIEIADKIHGEIISADSMQVYKGMDIGTAKLKKDEMRAASGRSIPHHMIDILDIAEPFSVATFKGMVEELIPEIWGRSKIPMLVGGTGLYIEAVIDPYKFTPLPVNKKLRTKLLDKGQTKGSQYLHQKLSQIDPISAKRIHPNDLKRIVRALEVFHETGMPISNFGKRAPGHYECKYNLCYIGLKMERQDLYEKINHRVEQMIASGLVDEVENILKAGYKTDLPPLLGLGYKQTLDYLNGEYDLAEAIALIKRDTRRYAKRQMTWFRRDERVQWVDVGEYPSQKELLNEILKIISRTIDTNVEIGK